MNQDEINSLIEQTDIVSLVSKYVNLEKQGKNYKGLCPFHNEKTPSFIVSPDKKMFNCFGCHKAGGALKFIEEIENVEYVEAVKILCDFNGVKYKGTSIKTDPNIKSYKIMDVAKEFYNRYLLEDKNSVNALAYLKERGIDESIIKDFDIGLSPNNYDTIYNVLTDLKYNELDISDIALIDRNESGKYHDLFVNRIMFPIKDEKNNTLGFSARIYIKDPNQPKYINSRETKIFKKNQVLFNINNAKPEIIRKDRIIIHEGQMDVIAAYKSGYKEAVCTLGTAIGDNQVRLISKLTHNVIIAYDGDKAGIESSIKAIKLFKKYNFNIHLVLFPDNMDPDEYVLKYGIEKYNEYFDSHIVDDIEYQYLVTTLDKDLTDKNILNKVKYDIFNLVSSLNSKIDEEKYLKRFSEYLNTSVDSVYLDYDGYKNINKVDIKPKVKKIVKEKKYNSECELRLIYYAMKSKSDALYIDKEIRNDLIAFSDESLKLWVSLVNTYYEEYSEFNEAIFVNMLSNEAFNQYKLLNDVLGKSINKVFDEEDMLACINHIKDLREDIKNKTLHENNLNLDDESLKSRNIDEMFKNRRNKEKRKVEEDKR